MERKINSKQLAMNVLNGAAHAVVVALVPNAVIALILSFFPETSLSLKLLEVAKVFQFFLPMLAGFLAANYQGLMPMQQAAVGGAAMLASGAWKSVDVTMNGDAMNIFQLAGVGDLINTMITIAFAIFVVEKIAHKFGSLNIILLPVVIGAGCGFLGYLLLPYVSQITYLVGNFINSLTGLQPMLMSILICISFSIIQLTPISTAAIALAIGLSGLAGGAAGMGVATTGVFLTVATARNKDNKPGTPIAIFLGGMKMMMPNFLTNPVMAAGLAISAAINAIPVFLYGLENTPAAAGFGLVGFISPIASLETPGMNVMLMFLFWIIIPVISAFISQLLTEKVLKIINPEIYTFKG